MLTTRPEPQCDNGKQIHDRADGKDWWVLKAELCSLSSSPQFPSAQLWETHPLHDFFTLSEWVVQSLNPSIWKHYLISKLSKFLPWTEGSYQHLVKFFLLQDLLPSFLSELVKGPPGSAVQSARGFFPLVQFSSSLLNGIGHQEPLETCLYGACAMQTMPMS